MCLFVLSVEFDLLAVLPSAGIVQEQSQAVVWMCLSEAAHERRQEVLGLPELEVLAGLGATIFAVAGD